MPKKWYDDWQLTASSPTPDLLDNIRLVTVELPNAPSPEHRRMQFTCKDGQEGRQLASLLDCLLSELTGTPTVALEQNNGPGRPRITG